MRVEMDCQAERKGRAQRISKWVAVHQVALTSPVFGPRLWKRLKKKWLAKESCRRVRKNIEIKGLAGQAKVGERWAALFT
jgi:hypothetical protein